MITSSEVSREIRRVVNPFLKEQGFTKIKGRNAYQYRDRVVVGFLTRAVGANFSQLTSFTPMSFGAQVWVHYLALSEASEMRLDTDGKPLPSTLHETLDLQCSETVVGTRDGITLPAEQARRDIWWLAADGSNLEAAVADLKLAYSEQAAPWLEIYANPSKAVSQFERGPDGFSKYEKIYLLSKSLGDDARARKYGQLYEEAAALIKRRRESTD